MKNKYLLLVPFILVTCMNIAMTSTVKAQEVVFAISPSTYEASEPGHTFQVNLTITDVTNLWSWMCVISWDPAVLSCVSVSKGPFIPDPVMWLAAPPNASAIPSLSCISMTVPKTGYNGSGTLATITFNATAVGNTYLRLTGTYLLDPKTTSTKPVLIEHTVEDGTVTVVPEFPTSIILPLFLMATAGIAVLVKIFAKKSRYCIKVP